MKRKRAPEGTLLTTRGRNTPGPCRLEDKGPQHRKRFTTLPPSNPPPSSWAGSHLPQQRSLLGSHSSCTLHFQIWFLREAAASSLVFFESSVFFQLFHKPLLARAASHIAFQNYWGYRHSFHPQYPHWPRHHLWMQILTPSEEFVSLPGIKKVVCVTLSPRVALERGHWAQPGLTSSILELHRNRITQYVNHTVSVWLCLANILSVKFTHVIVCII